MKTEQEINSLKEVVNNKVDTLLVIGNGADLYCGLKSSFKYYLENKKEYIDCLNNWFNSYDDFIIHIDNVNHKVNNFVYTDNFDTYLDSYRFVLPVFEDVMSKTDKYRNPHICKQLKLMDSKLICKNGCIFSNDSEKLLKINFWDILLIKKVNGNYWYDVEEAVKNFLVPYKKGKYSNAMIFDDLLKKINHDKNEKQIYNKKNIINKPELDFNSEDIKKAFGDNVYLELFIIAYKYLGMSNYDNAYDFLYRELNIFENSFENYLIKEVCYLNDLDINEDEFSNRLYDKRSLNLFRILSRKSNVNILDFNYTRPQITDLMKENVILNLHGSENKKCLKVNYLGRINKIRNIHGNIKYNSKYMDSSIVLGIDTNYYNDIPKSNLSFFDKYQNLKSYIDDFTKARRIMDFSGIDNVDQCDTVLEPTIKKIRFFGHSLGEADYSYFQAIFDFYNIYSNQIILEFIYSIHCDEFNSKMMKVNQSNKYVKLNNIHIKKQNNKVFKLINDYGKTLDNVNHGKNLLQKMLTEGRLRVLSIDDLIDYENQ
ncbi:AbiH family protein [Apilactobacillus xinyiensis]|uniref:AbiH family protein n=1 Tax=Apilactobacillus xinyiensis TaxID=2841032 RepID=UPI002010BB1D|nr:AbiH family protein [Apilactobacillus xinyiensis]MCL0330630.1 AbiH family protein [Apilactobacillus xinyiensis]